MKNSIKRNMLTNWKDGMKISRFHFEQSEAALVDCIHSGLFSFVNNHNFGLVANVEGLPSSLDVNVVKNVSESIFIKVSTCRGISSGGVSVQLIPEICSEIEYKDRVVIPSVKNVSSVPYYLVISVDYNERIPTGSADSNEEPLRLPYVHPSYKLHIVEKSELGSLSLRSAHLVIGKLNSKGSDLIWDNNYIPPCTTVRSHRLLKAHYDTIAAQLGTIQDSASSIINKVVNKNQNSPLAYNIKIFCEKIIVYVSSLFFPYRFIIHQQAPVHFAHTIVQLANHIKLAIDSMHEKEKEDMLLYFKEWNEISPGKFEEMLKAIMEIDYNHHEIAETIEPLVEFAESIASLLERLDNLELIGKRKGDKNMIVRETNTGQKKKFNIID